MGGANYTAQVNINVANKKKAAEEILGAIKGPYAAEVVVKTNKASVAKLKAEMAEIATEASRVQNLKLATTYSQDPKTGNLVATVQPAIQLKAKKELAALTEKQILAEKRVEDSIAVQVVGMQKLLASKKVQSSSKEASEVRTLATEYIRLAAVRERAAKWKNADGTATFTATQLNEKFGQRLQTLADKTKVANSGLSSMTGSMRTWADSMKNAITQTISYSLSIGLVYGALNQLKQGIQYVMDLNEEMTKIQVLQAPGAQTKEEIEALAESYNNLAKEMGVSTIEVAKASTEWLRQGKTVAETMDLVRASMMLSKLGAMDSAEATKSLTAILNGYNMSTKDAIEVVDQLVKYMPKRMVTCGYLYLTN